MSTLLGTLNWIANAVIFFCVGLFFAGFPYIIFDEFFGIVPGLIAGLVTFVIVGSIAVKATNAIARGFWNILDGAKKN